MCVYICTAYPSNKPTNCKAQNQAGGSANGGSQLVLEVLEKSGPTLAAQIDRLPVRGMDQGSIGHLWVGGEGGASSLSPLLLRIGRYLWARQLPCLDFRRFGWCALCTVQVVLIDGLCLLTLRKSK